MTSTMTGMETAALVIMQMSPAHAAQVLRQFSEEEAEEIAAEIIRLRKVEDGHAEAAITEFHARTRSGRADTRGGRDAAASLLETAFGEERAAGLLDRAVSTAGGHSFEFMDNVDPSNVSRVLDGEAPGTIALVLAHLRPEVASHVLGAFGTSIRADIAQALATMGTPNPEIVEIVAETLRQRIRSAVAPADSTEVTGGVQPLVDIVKRSDVAAEYELLEELEKRDPALAEEMRSRMLNFGDIVKFEDRDVQQIIRGLDASALATALHGADEVIAELVRANMSERNRELLDDEITLLTKVRKTAVVEARAEIVKQMRELESTGAIAVKEEGDGASDDDEDEAGDVA
ncbi:MAG: flagellar motor switch protein FliG [Leifsonia sp.]|nr:flagellar motor switch protein FliG [Leifsonia sp.]